MDKLLEALQALSEDSPIIVGITAILAILGFLKGLFSEKDGITLFERRNQYKVEKMQKDFENEKEPLLKQEIYLTMQEAKFKNLTRISAPFAFQEELIKLKSVDKRFGWGVIREARNHLKFDEEGRLESGIDIYSWSTLVYHSLVSVLFIYLMYLSLDINSGAGAISENDVLIAIGLPLFFAFLGFAFFVPALGVIRALQLQKSVRKVVSGRSPNPPAQPIEQPARTEDISRT